ncbi:MAG TPA: tetratricopeptide repeat protein, partial [Mycobacteriales bacterium]|nr:tetratricopeptide repeat protein [Mycobacteriales bacterium]
AVWAAADALLRAWPEVEADTTLGQVLRANAAVLAGRHPTALWEPDAHPVLFRLGQSLGEAGLVADAARHFTGLVADSARVLGPDHPDTLTTRGNLAFWRGEAGDVAGAAAAFEALLADDLRVLGPDHPDTLTTRHNLAWWRGEAGDAAGAVTEAVLADQLRRRGSGG